MPLNPGGCATLAAYLVAFWTVVIMLYGPMPLVVTILFFIGFAVVVNE